MKQNKSFGIYFDKKNVHCTYLDKYGNLFTNFKVKGVSQYSTAVKKLPLELSVAMGY
jgi:S-adenosylmethionine hydrolase